MNQLFKRFRRDISGLLWLSTAIFLGLTLWSFEPTDPSFNSIGNTLSARNYCGYFGSFLADLLYQLLGLSAWVLVLASGRMAVRSFLGKDVALSKARFLLAALLILTLASLIALYAPQTKLFAQQIPAGGALGVIVAQALIHLFNSLGVAVILWTLAVVLVVFYTERPLEELFKYPLELAHKTLAGCKQALSAVGVAWRALRSRVSLPVSMPEISFASEGRASAPAKRFVLNRAIKGTEKFFDVNDKADVTDKATEVATEVEPAPRVSGFFSLSQKEEGPKRKVVLKAKVQRRVENWELPKLALLDDPPISRTRLDEKEIKEKARLLTDKLAQFSVRGHVVGIKPGPAVTMFEFKPAADVKISKITDLADDLSLALSSESVRIIAPIPGRDVVGIETSNSHRDGVYLKDILAQDSFWDDECKLPLALGRKADGEPRVVDLRKMPHLLVAGTTGSGKSVFVVSLLTGLLFRHSPKTLKLILVDPKQVDLAAFNNLPHLIMPPIREPKKAVGALRWAIREMEKRYRSMSKFGARGIESFNEIVEALSRDEIAKHEKTNEELEGAGRLESYYFTAQPYIVIVVEEFGDLMAVDKANVEQAVVRLAQMARACGIHLMLAMQSPRKDVVTGLIKTNIPGRISFKVASKMDSRIILDESGAERLLARGDMLFLAPGVAKPERHHGPFLTESEISQMVQAWQSQGEPEYDPVALRAIEGSGGGYDLSGEGESEDTFGDDDIKDERYDEVLSYVADQKEVSASLLQRKFRLGYPRAARMIEIFEAEGVIGPANGSKPRQVLVNSLK